MKRDINERVQRLLDSLIASGEEVGLQAAAYVDGELVVDAWAGVADEATGRKVDGDTLFTSWSTTKGWAATCIHILADRGVIEYDAPIARYWPQFAANGKAAATVRHALTHQAGVPQMPDGVTAEMMCDWEAMASAIAAMAPLWEPGTKTGYHAWTFGWLLGEIVRRADGRPIARFVQDEVCKPLGITDFYMGIPDQVQERVATLRNEPPPADAPPPTPLALRAMPENITNARTVNRPDIRRACIPGGGGIMSARAIARHYAMLANDGELDGVRVLSPGRVDIACAQQTDDVDLTSGLRRRRALGYVLGGAAEDGGNPGMGPSPRAFGHGGLGGSMGFADPERRLSFGLTKTLLKVTPDPSKATATVVANAVREGIRA
jgi:CubicO group peptidase (beta-lactamase class C family)